MAQRQDAAKPGRRRWLAYGGAGLAAAAVGVGLAWRQAGQADGASDIFYTQTLDDLEGRAYKFDQWRGRRLVVNFWATWCPPCVDEMPELDALHRELAGSVQFVGIGIDSAANMRAFVQKVPVGYPLLVAGNVGTELARVLGNSAGGLPYTVVIDEKGAVIHHYTGRIKLDALRGALTAA
ncbi:TlpA family protein disulfide reductase [Pigmentiphaga humi]|nr:TlpA disulfide reductase family protein [Pigmentiphaga humi]